MYGLREGTMKKDVDYHNIKGEWHVVFTLKQYRNLKLRISLITALSLISLVILPVYTNYKINYRIEKIQERTNMMFFDEEKIELYDGFYSDENYYCVWTKEKTPEEIANIDEHEKCHVLADKQHEHFCNNKTTK